MQSFSFIEVNSVITEKMQQSRVENQRTSCLTSGLLIKCFEDNSIQTPKISAHLLSPTAMFLYHATGPTLLLLCTSDHRSDGMSHRRYRFIKSSNLSPDRACVDQIFILRQLPKVCHTSSPDNRSFLRLKDAFKSADRTVLSLLITGGGIPEKFLTS